MPLLKFNMPGADALAEARTKIDSLPAIIDALGKVPSIVKAMPSAPVIAGALTRMAADAIGKELARRGPSPGFIAACDVAGVDAAAALMLHEQLVMEIGR